MLRRMGAKQFLDWNEYAQREPFGMWWITTLVARLMQFYANANRDEKKRPEPYALDDFMLELVNDRPFKTQTWQQQKKIARMIVDAWNLQEAQKEERRRRRNGA